MIRERTEDNPFDNPPLNGIQRSYSFRDKYCNLLRTSQDVHMYVNGSYDCCIEEFNESVEVLRLKLQDWVDHSLPGTCQAGASWCFDNAVKAVIQAALTEAELYLQSRANLSS